MFKKVCYKLLIIFMTIVFVLPTGVIAGSFSNLKETAEEKILLEYIYIDKYNIPNFDKERAINDDLNQELIASGEFFQEIVNSEMELDSNELQPQALRMPYWGNWCGPGYPTDPSTNPVPIDILDTICRTHDKCYGSRGYHKCSCDENMQASLRRDISKMTGGQKVAANGMLIWINIKVSNRNSTGGNLSCKW